MLYSKKLVSILIVLLCGGLLYYGSLDIIEKRAFDNEKEITTIHRNSYIKQNFLNYRSSQIQQADYSLSGGPGFQGESKGPSLCRRKAICPLTYKNDNNLTGTATKKTLIIISRFNKNQVSIRILRRVQTDRKCVYMLAEIMLTDNGGLPLSAFSNLNLEQFFDGTYFPPLYISNPLEQKALNGFITVSSRSTGIKR